MRFAGIRCGSKLSKGITARSSEGTDKSETQPRPLGLRDTLGFAGSFLAVI
jgi:hypothetical protein